MMWIDFMAFLLPVNVSNPNGFSNFFIRYFFQSHHDHGALDFCQLFDGPLKTVEILFALISVVIGNVKMNFLKIFCFNVPCLFPEARDGRVQGDAIHPGGNLGFTTKGFK